MKPESFSLNENDCPYFVGTASDNDPFRTKYSEVKSILPLLNVLNFKIT